MADFPLLESLKLISRKIWVIEKSWNFHTVQWKVKIFPICRKKLNFSTLKNLPPLISFLTLQNSMCTSMCAPLCYATTVIVIFDLLWTISFMILFKSPRQMHISFHCSRKHFLPKHKIRGNFLHFCLTPSNGTSPVRPTFISSVLQWVTRNFYKIHFE